MTRRSNRRDFLTGRAASDAMADALGAALPDEGVADPTDRAAGPTYLVRVARRAMACEFAVCFHALRQDRNTEIALEALDLVEALEDQMSVFLPESEICRINRTAADREVAVEPRLFELLELAFELYRQTDGAFDPTAGPLWEAWGFARRAGTVPSEDQLAEALQSVGGHLVRLDPKQKTIRFARPGVRLNLGSIGKGHALDRCAERLHEAGMADWLLHGGHSSVLVRGSARQMSPKSTDARPEGWLVGLRNPLRGDQRLAEIRLRDRALATSGSRTQSFVHAGRRYGHVLDPRSGRPAEGTLSATAIAPRAALADALSTAFFVMGPDAAMDYCRTRPEIAAVLVCPARHSGGFEIRSAGLAQDELTLLEQERG